MTTFLQRIADELMEQWVKISAAATAATTTTTAATITSMGLPLPQQLFEPSVHTNK